MNEKKGRAKPPVRPIRFSLRAKFTLLVLVILVFTVSVVANFLIQYLGDIRSAQLRDTMSVYLQTFHKNIDSFYLDPSLSNTGSSEKVMDFIRSYTNIGNFKRAMLVNNTGIILLDTDRQNLYHQVFESTLAKFERLYQDGMVLSELIETNSNVTVTFTSNLKAQVIKISNGTGSNAIYRDVRTNILSVTTNRRVDTRILMKTFEGLQAVYNPLIIKASARTDIQKPAVRGEKPVTNIFTKSPAEYYKGLSLAIERYESGGLFYRTDVTDEIRNDFRFMAAFRLYVSRRGLDEPSLVTNTERRTALLKRSGLTEDDYLVLRLSESRFIDFENAQEFTLTVNELSRLLDILSRLGMPKKEVQEYTALRREKDALFANPTLFSPELAANLRYIALLGGFINEMSEGGGSTANIAWFVRKNKGINPDYTAYFDPSGLRRSVQGLKGLYNRLVMWRQGELSLEKAGSGSAAGKNILRRSEIERSFGIWKGFYRVGVIRIMLHLKDLKIEEVKVQNAAADMAVMIILRALAVTFVVVSLFIAPIGSLAEETDAIAGGNLDKRLDIRTNDEIGQLADKFNIMTSSLKKYIAEVADKARMEDELRTAREIQETILPASFPSLPGYGFSVFYKPQTESGGDFYDFIQVDGRHVGIVVADVTGHGVRAGIVMAMFMSALRTFAKGRRDAAKVIRDINPILLRDTPGSMFATVFYGVVDTESGEMYYSLAGHNPGYIFNPGSSDIKVMKPGGMPVGMIESEIFDPSLELFKIKFKKGDILVQYTDGITEAKSRANEEYGDERFIDSIRRNASEDLDAMRDGLLNDLRAFTNNAPQSDDITLLLMRVG